MRPGLRARLLMLAMLASLPALASPPPSPVAIESWVTSADGTQRLQPAPLVHFGTGPAPERVIEVDATRRYQAWAGVGAAITDATAITLTRALDPASRMTLLRELFGRGEGLGLSLTRVAIGASDFSATHYSLDDMPGGGADPTLAAFDLEAGGAPLIPILAEARALNPQLKVFAATWSAPAWMKDTGSLIRGHLRPDAYEAFAQYLKRTADGYAAAGVPLYGLTLQNEPGFEPLDYPGMRVEAEARADLFSHHLGPAFAGDPAAPRLYDWDHNWDRPASPLAVLADPAAAATLSGVAWHCYYGPIAAQSEVHDRYPDKEAWMTECAGGGWSPKFDVALRFFTGTVFIDGARNWSRGAILWNLVLDEAHGPHLGGCRNCRGVVTVDSTSGAITRNVEYYALGHFSRFVRPGAVRIDSTTFPGTLRSVAFLNIDDGSEVLVVCNDGDEVEFGVRSDGELARYRIPAGSVATLRWHPRH